MHTGAALVVVAGFEVVVTVALDVVVVMACDVEVGLDEVVVGDPPRQEQAEDAAATFPQAP
jgi:hypothetical protein